MYYFCPVITEIVLVDEKLTPFTGYLPQISSHDLFFAQCSYIDVA